MKNKFLKYFIGILIFINFLQLPLKVEEIRNEDNFFNKIDIDYLNKEVFDDYIIGTGDLLRIIVSKSYPELDTLVNIDGEGKIYIPKLNRIYVSGLTLNELNKLLDKSYKKYIKYPMVQTEVVSYRPVKILINGEINNPGYILLEGSLEKNAVFEDFNNELSGQTIFEDNLFKQVNRRIKPEKINSYYPTLFDAIRRSGGITTFSSLRDIEVIRKNSISEGGGYKKAVINFERFLTNGDISQNIRIYDGDQIKVKKLAQENIKTVGKSIRANLNPKYIRVYIAGRVNIPGPLTINKSSTLNDAVDLAGGAKVLKGKLKYISFKNDGSIDKREIRYRKNSKRGSLNNPYLKNGDLIYVGNSILSTSSEIIKEITEPLEGIYSTYRLIELITE